MKKAYISENEFEPSIDDNSVDTELDITAGLMNIIEESLNPQLSLTSQVTVDDIAMVIDVTNTDLLIDNPPVNIIQSTEINALEQDLNMHVDIQNQTENISRVIISNSSIGMKDKPLLAVESGPSFNNMTSETVNIETALIMKDNLSVELSENESLISMCPVIDLFTLDDGVTLPGVTQIIEDENHVNEISGDFTGTNYVNFEDIELYLECTDDNEPASLLDTYLPNQPGTSLIRSDRQLKISFPPSTEEKQKGFKCCVCKKTFTLSVLLQDHIAEKHCSVPINMCAVCSYNTKSKKYFENHLKTRHKDCVHLTNCRSLSVLNDNDTILNGNKVQPMESNFLETLVSKLDTSKRPVSDSDVITSEKAIDQSIILTLKNGSDNINLESEHLRINDYFANDNVMSITNTNLDTKSDESDALTIESHTELLLNKVDESNIGLNNNEFNIKTKDRGMLFVCEVCEFVTKSLKLLNNHKSTLHDDNRNVFHCQTCPFTCKQKRSYDAHIKIHKGMYSYKCETCSKVFVTKSIYTRHLKAHRITRDYVCDVNGCGTKFKMKGQLTDHMKKVHQASRTSKATSKSTHLSVLSKINSPVDKSTSVHFINNNVEEPKKSRLKEKTSSLHLLKLGDVIKKSKTNKTVTRSTELDEHVDETTTGSDNHNDLEEKVTVVNMSCAVTGCSESISSNNGDPVNIETCMPINEDTLNDTKTNTLSNEAKTYLCNFAGCGKKFRDCYNLNKHLCVHTKIKNISCPYCEFVCIQKSSLNHHLSKNHSNKNINY